MLSDSVLKCKHTPACLHRAIEQPRVQQTSFRSTGRSLRSSSITPFKPHKKQGNIHSGTTCIFYCKLLSTLSFFKKTMQSQGRETNKLSQALLCHDCYVEDAPSYPRVRAVSEVAATFRYSKPRGKTISSSSSRWHTSSQKCTAGCGRDRNPRQTSRAQSFG